MAKQPLDDAQRLIIAMRNAEAVAQTICDFREQIVQLTQQVGQFGVQIQNLQNRINQQQTQIHQSLVKKYGTGPTA